MMMLKEKALMWFHSKLDFIVMCYDDIMSELKMTFGHGKTR